MGKTVLNLYSPTVHENLHPVKRRHRERSVAAQVAFERAKFVTSFSRWVKGQAQGLEPGGFKLWVN